MDNRPQDVKAPISPSVTTPPTTTGSEEPLDAEPALEPPADEPAAPEEPPSDEAPEAEPEMDEANVSARNPLAGCELCHVDIEDEFTPSLHFAEKVACVDCHGLSEGHVADENNDIKPDVVFDRENTDPLCEECHACSRPEKSRPAEDPPQGPAICTDCHGHHDLGLKTKDG